MSNVRPRNTSAARMHLCRSCVAHAACNRYRVLSTSEHRASPAARSGNAMNWCLRSPRCRRVGQGRTSLPCPTPLLLLGTARGRRGRSVARSQCRAGQEQWGQGKGWFWSSHQSCKPRQAGLASSSCQSRSTMQPMSSLVFAKPKPSLLAFVEAKAGSTKARQAAANASRVPQWASQGRGLTLPSRGRLTASFACR